MTREEAVEVLKERYLTCVGIGLDNHANRVNEAINMAIEALSEPKTIIGIDIPYGSDKGLATIFKGKDEKLILEEIKEIVSVVRCKDCIHWQKTNIETIDGEPIYDCPFCGEWADANGFCSFGERR